MMVVFVSGPYRGDVSGNIERAKQVAIRLWKLGYAVVCPHLNTAHFDGICPDETWLKGDLEIMSRCDAVYMMAGWDTSTGATAERQEAINQGKIIIYESSGMLVKVKERE
jgi:hypothetical protein